MEAYIRVKKGERIVRIVLPSITRCSQVIELFKLRCPELEVDPNPKWSTLGLNRSAVEEREAVALLGKIL